MTNHSRRGLLAAATMLMATAGLAKTGPRIYTIIGTGQPGIAADGEAAATA